MRDGTCYLSRTCNIHRVALDLLSCNVHRVALDLLGFRVYRVALEGLFENVEAQ